MRSLDGTSNDGLPRVTLPDGWVAKLNSVRRKRFGQAPDRAQSLRPCPRGTRAKPLLLQLEVQPCFGNYEFESHQDGSRYV
jgi:hypothetical protein